MEILIDLHSRGVVHGDVRLENVMAWESNGRLDVRLIDFGSSVEDTSAFYQDFQGLGRMTYELIAGTRLITDDVREMARCRIRDQRAWDFIMALTSAQNVSYSSVADTALNHEWFHTS
jgi:serine/threonine protein kinase